MTRKSITAVAAAVLVASAGATGLAMSQHWLNGGPDGSGNVGCWAAIDDMDPGLDYPGHTIEVILYGPSGEVLGAYEAGNNGIFLNAGVFRPSAGSGTYHCRANFREWYDEIDHSIHSENDSMDYYFDI